MNIVKTIEQYNDDFVYFCEPIKNNIMNNGSFIRILYSTPTFILNGIYLSILINQLTIEKYFNKYKCSFETASHIGIIQRLKSIEIRKELTDEWKKRGLKEGSQFAILTEIITKAWSEKSTKEYKILKGLKKENLRDNMAKVGFITYNTFHVAFKSITGTTAQVYSKRL